MSLIIKDMELPKGCWNCPFRLSGMIYTVCLCTGKPIAVDLDKGADSNCPLRSADDLTEYVKESFRDEDGIARDEYWHHNTVLKVVRSYFEDGRYKNA